MYKGECGGQTGEQISERENWRGKENHPMKGFLYYVSSLDFLFLDCSHLEIRGVVGNIIWHLKMMILIALKGFIK